MGNSLPAMGGIRRKFMAKELRGTVSGADLLEKEQEEKVIEWDTLFRRNWDIYAEFYLDIGLKPYQREALHEIGTSDVFFWRAGRGGAKSFITALAAICKLMLYPNCWIVVTASTIDQANKIVEDKILSELVKKLSPYLLYLYEKQWLVITKPQDGYKIENTLNNSVLRVLAPVESSRGVRSNFTIYDEVAIMKKASIDQIFDGMLYPRQPVFLNNNPEYANNPRWLEESKAIYLTSSKYKYQWWYGLWKECVKGWFDDKKTVFNVFASDFFDNIDNGLKTWGDYRRAKKTTEEFSFRMEYLNEAIGENEHAYFTIQQFKENQTLEKAFVPPTNIEVITQTVPYNPPKGEDEVRLILVDYAFANTVKGAGRKANDNTIIICMSLHWKENHFERHVDYIQGWEASDSTGAVNRIRELYWDYQTDYIVDDQQSGGEVIYNLFTQPWEHPERGRAWNSHGFTISDKTEYVSAVAIDSKIEDYKMRTVDPHAIPCIIPVKGSSTLNDIVWKEMRRQLEYGNVKFLIDTNDFQETLVDNGEYFKMTSEQYGIACAPYNHTEELIKEAVNLKAEFKQDKVRLSEPLNGTKDRIVALAYGNYIATLIENRWNKDIAQDEFDIDSIQLVW